MLSSFKCSRDTDVENFLKNKSIRFEKSDVSRTFLILDECNLMNEENKFNILGYFSLSMRNIALPEEMKKSLRRKLDGINKEATSVDCFLIGQLGKNDSFCNLVKGEEILQYALDMINEARGIIGKRVVLVECKDKEKILNFYQDNSFIEVGKNEETNLLRLIKLHKD